MKQLLQNLRTGEGTVADVPVPVVQPGRALVRTAASLISAGTEKMVIDLAQKSLVGKAKERPDLVRQVLGKLRRDGVMATLRTVKAKLDAPLALGYSCAGVVAEAEEGAGGAGDDLPVEEAHHHGLQHRVEDEGGVEQHAGRDEHCRRQVR